MAGRRRQADERALIRIVGFTNRDATIGACRRSYRTHRMAICLPSERATIEQKMKACSNCVPPTAASNSGECRSARRPACRSGIDDANAVCSFCHIPGWLRDKRNASWSQREERCRRFVNGLRNPCLEPALNPRGRGRSVCPEADSAAETARIEWAISSGMFPRACRGIIYTSHASFIVTNCRSMSAGSLTISGSCYGSLRHQRTRTARVVKL